MQDKFSMARSADLPITIFGITVHVHDYGGLLQLAHHIIA
jgi:hypothetical protein